MRRPTPDTAAAICGDDGAIELAVYADDTEAPFGNRTFRLSRAAAQRLLGDLRGAIARQDHAYAPRQPALPL